MKFMHISDLHIGKRINEFSLLEDQKYILKEIVNIAGNECVDAILIAGDVYDKSMPAAEAVELLDQFLYELASLKKEVFIISGNHDSPERLAFGNRLMEKSGVNISPVYNGEIHPITLKDEHGYVDFYMLPFIKPIHVRRYYPEDVIESYTDAVTIALKNTKYTKENRKVLLTHQFVTGAIVSGSEELTVGGSENVSASCFDEFDYVALGHIHGAQNVGTERIRYCGTPLKYSFSESKHIKSVTIVTLLEKNNMTIKTVELKPLRDLVQLKGSYMEITDKAFYEKTTLRDDYIHITLTDEEDIVEGLGKLRTIYKNLMKLDYDNSRTRSKNEVMATEDIELKSPLELFKEFYRQQNGRDMTEKENQHISKLIETVWEASK